MGSVLGRTSMSDIIAMLYWTTLSARNLIAYFQAENLQFYMKIIFVGS